MQWLVLLRGRDDIYVILRFPPDYIRLVWVQDHRIDLIGFKHRSHQSGWKGSYHFWIDEHYTIVLKRVTKFNKQWETQDIKDGVPFPKELGAWH